MEILNPTSLWRLWTFPSYCTRKATIELEYGFFIQLYSKNRWPHHRYSPIYLQDTRRHHQMLLILGWSSDLFVIGENHKNRTWYIYFQHRNERVKNIKLYAVIRKLWEKIWKIGAKIYFTQHTRRWSPRYNEASIRYHGAHILGNKQYYSWTRVRSNFQENSSRLFVCGPFDFPICLL